MNKRAGPWGEESAARTPPRPPGATTGWGRGAEQGPGGGTKGRRPDVRLGGGQAPDSRLYSAISLFSAVPAIVGETAVPSDVAASRSYPPARGRGYFRSLPGAQKPFRVAGRARGRGRRGSERGSQKGAECGQGRSGTGTGRGSSVSGPWSRVARPGGPFVGFTPRLAAPVPAAPGLPGDSRVGCLVTACSVTAAAGGSSGGRGRRTARRDGRAGDASWAEVI